MKYKLTSILLALAACASVAIANEQATSLEFTPDGHYGVGKPGARPDPVYAATELNVANAPLRHVQVALTAAQIIAMYTTPVVLVAAQGSGKAIVVTRAEFKIVRSATAFTGGGAAIIQYDSTANGAGTNAVDSTLASTVITGSAGTSKSLRNGAVISDSTALDNKGIYISNATAVFATGTGTATVDLWYTVL